jgi:hypothetical protein
MHSNFFFHLTKQLVMMIFMPINQFAADKASLHFIVATLLLLPRRGKLHSVAATGTPGKKYQPLGFCKKMGQLPFPPFLPLQCIVVHVVSTIQKMEGSGHAPV